MQSSIGQGHRIKMTKNDTSNREGGGNKQLALTSLVTNRLDSGDCSRDSQAHLLFQNLPELPVYFLHVLANGILVEILGIQSGQSLLVLIPILPPSLTLALDAWKSHVLLSLCEIFQQTGFLSHYLEKSIMQMFDDHCVRKKTLSYTELISNQV